MKVIKNINNNVSLCLDSQNREVIVFGKGIGFTKPPYKVPLEKIERTFYSVNDSFLNVIESIPEAVLNVAIRIVDHAGEVLDAALPSSAAISLADHIHFAIERMEKNMQIDVPLQEHLKQIYQKQIGIGKTALKMIEQDLKVKLPESEAVFIAMLFINIRAHEDNVQAEQKSNILNDCTTIVEDQLHMTIDRNSFNYSRFITHLDYLLHRVQRNAQTVSCNVEMFDNLKKQYPHAYACAMEIQAYVQAHMEIQLNEEELIYLMIHINRLRSREGCYR